MCLSAAFCSLSDITTSTKRVVFIWKGNDAVNELYISANMISQIAKFAFVLITFKCISNSVAAKNIKEIIEFHFSLLIHYPFGLVLYLLNEKNINFHEVLHDFIDHRMSFQIFISLHSGHINVYSKLNTSRYSFVLKCFCSFFFFLFLWNKNWWLFFILEIKKSIKLPK